MNIGWPEGIWIALAVLNLLGAMALDGEPKSGRYSAAVTLISTMLAFGLLYWGGFFS